MSNVGFEIVADSEGAVVTASSPVSDTIISAKTVLRAAVVGDVEIEEARVAGGSSRYWSVNLPPVVVEMVREMPLDAMVDSYFLEALSAAADALAASRSLSEGAASNLRKTAADARASLRLGFVSRELLRDLVWLSLAYKVDFRNEEMDDFLVIQVDPRVPVRSRPVAFVIRNPALSTGVIVSAVALGFYYATRQKAS